MDQQQSTSRIGLIVIIVTFVALAQLLFFTYKEREITECQAEVNVVFLDTLKQRESINDADRESMEKLVSDVSSAQTQEDVDTAFSDFEQRKIQIHKLRDSFKYPNIEGACT